MKIKIKYKLNLNYFKSLINLNKIKTAVENSLIKDLMSRKIEDGYLLLTQTDIDRIRGLKFNWLLNSIKKEERFIKPRNKVNRMFIITYEDEDGISKIELNKPDMNKWISFMESLRSSGNKFKVINIETKIMSTKFSQKLYSAINSESKDTNFLNLIQKKFSEALSNGKSEDDDYTLISNDEGGVDVYDHENSELTKLIKDESGNPIPINETESESESKPEMNSEDSIPGKKSFSSDDEYIFRINSTDIKIDFKKKKALLVDDPKISIDFKPNDSIFAVKKKLDDLIESVSYSEPIQRKDYSKFSEKVQKRYFNRINIK